jgi:hypothetical protein
MALNNRQRWTMGGGVSVLLIVLAPLIGEFRQPGITAWNVFLVLLVVGLIVGVILLQRHLAKNIDQVGEARFDTRNK